MHIMAHIKPGGLTYREAVNVARKRVDDGEMYLISRYGGWFRPEAHGYCCTYAEAGVFSAAEARSYLDIEGLSVVPLTSVKKQISIELETLALQAFMARDKFNRLDSRSSEEW